VKAWPNRIACTTTAKERSLSLLPAMTTDIPKAGRMIHNSARSVASGGRRRWLGRVRTRYPYSPGPLLWRDRCGAGPTRGALDDFPYRHGGNMDTRHLTKGTCLPLVADKQRSGSCCQLIVPGQLRWRWTHSLFARRALGGNRQGRKRLIQRPAPVVLVHLGPATDKSSYSSRG
jgi:hypothetical protein